MIAGVGPVTAKKLIAFCGGLEAVFKEKKTGLLKIPGVGENLAKSILSKDVFALVDKEIDFIEKNKIRALFYLDADYPFRLKHCDDGPILLFVKGETNLNSDKMLAVVGTRSITSYGKELSQKVIEGLAPQQPVIVSGLAYGVDAAAHKASIENHLPTVGVLGHGLDRIYPPLHQSLAERMLENGGALISDFTSGTIPDKENFPKRNRIIAGISDAVLVVEAAKSGGALITAQIANTYNRDVFAFPGRIGDAYSEGCNHLIKTNQAALIQSHIDIEYIMGWSVKQKAKPNQALLFHELTETESVIMDVLKSEVQPGIDLICKLSGQSMGKVSATLLELEFKGLVRSLPGKQYALAL
ncbi:MAG: DNA-protecting protein DprA [Bacteroidales bacterium]|nr:DNA-protecting protein DprA [Bacteroidales bacterium]